MRFIVGNKYRLRNGMTAKIYEIAAGYGNQYIHGAYSPNGDNAWVSATWFISGKFGSGDNDGMDIVRRIPEPIGFDKSCLPSWANWITMTNNGIWHWHKDRPDFNNDGYWQSQGNVNGVIPPEYEPKTPGRFPEESIYHIDDLE